MWLRASYTIENSVIIPLFCMIVVAVMSVCCNIHDRIVLRNIQAQAAIEEELTDMNDDESAALDKQAELYLKDRTVFDDYDSIDSDASLVKTSCPEKTIRIMRAVVEALD